MYSEVFDFLYQKVSENVCVRWDSLPKSPEQLMNSILNFSQERTIRADSKNLHSELHPPMVDTVTMLMVIMHAGF